MRYRMIFGAVALCLSGLMQVLGDGKISTISVQKSPETQPVVAMQSTTSTNTLQSTESIVLTIDTTSGNNYQIQGVGDLVRQVWANIGDTFTADSTNTTVSFAQSDGFCFFRAVSLKDNPSLNQPPPPPTAPPAIPSAPPF